MLGVKWLHLNLDFSIEDLGRGGLINQSTTVPQQQKNSETFSDDVCVIEVSLLDNDN